LPSEYKTPMRFSGAGGLCGIHFRKKKRAKSSEKAFCVATTYAFLNRERLTLCYISISVIQ
jgi:hypothetical protein